MILKEWYQDFEIDEIDLTTAQFQVQLHGMPLSIASPHNIALIGAYGYLVRSRTTSLWGCLQEVC